MIAEQKKAANRSMSSAAKILIVEDELPLVELLRYNFTQAGFAVVHAENGEEAELIVSEDKPDLIILDWMLPSVSGIEICRRLRSRTETKAIPILMLTSKGEESDAIRALDMGADDYITKPFSLPNLLARVKATLRRAAPERIADVLRIGDIELDRQAHRVTRGARTIRMGPTEFRLLEFLMQRSGRVLSRAQLLDGVWGQDAYVDERTVDVHIGRLRKSLVRGRENDPIRTVRGAGYVIDQHDGLRTG